MIIETISANKAARTWYEKRKNPREIEIRENKKLRFDGRYNNKQEEGKMEIRVTAALMNGVSKWGRRM